MSKFENPKVQLGKIEWELRCDGLALSRIEDVFDGKGFQHAIAELMNSGNGMDLSMKKVAGLFCALVVTKEDQKPPKVDWVLRKINTAEDTIRIMEAVSNAILAHFPNLDGGDAAATGEPDPSTTVSA